MNKTRLSFPGPMTDRFPFDVIPAAVNMLSTCRPIQKNRSHGKLEQLCRELGKRRERAQAHSLTLLPLAASYPLTVFPVWLITKCGGGRMMQLWLASCSIIGDAVQRHVRLTPVTMYRQLQTAARCQTTFSLCDWAYGEISVKNSDFNMHSTPRLGGGPVGI